jgi:hypothetical protein
MSAIKHIKKTAKLSKVEIIEIQLCLYAYFNKVTLSESEIKLLILIVMNNSSDVVSICNNACLEDEREKDIELEYKDEIFKSPQTVRNVLTKLINMKILIKQNKFINLNPELKIITDDKILLDMKYYCI